MLIKNLLQLFQVSYAIGVAHPLSVSIFHYGTSQKSERELLDIVRKNFDLRPGIIVRYGAVFSDVDHPWSTLPSKVNWEEDDFQKHTKTCTRDS